MKIYILHRIFRTYYLLNFVRPKNLYYGNVIFLTDGTDKRTKFALKFEALSLCINLKELSRLCRNFQKNFIWKGNVKLWSP